MNYHDIHKAVNEMNQLGSELVPFLFGFDFELKNAFLIKNPLTQKDILFRTPDAANYELPACPGNTDLIIEISDFIGKDDYCKSFESVMRAIERGYRCLFFKWHNAAAVIKTGNSQRSGYKYRQTR